MRIDAITAKPQQLKNAIDEALRESKLRTWRKVLNDNNETLYSHIPEQWNEKQC